MLFNHTHTKDLGIFFTDIQKTNNFHNTRNTTDPPQHQIYITCPGRPKKIFAMFSNNQTRTKTLISGLTCCRNLCLPYLILKHTITSVLLKKYSIIRCILIRQTFPIIGIKIKFIKHYF